MLDSSAFGARSFQTWFYFFLNLVLIFVHLFVVLFPISGAELFKIWCSIFPNLAVNLSKPGDRFGASVSGSISSF